MCSPYPSILNSTFHEQLLYVFNIYLPQTTFFVYLYLPMKKTYMILCIFLCLYICFVHTFETTEFKSCYVLVKIVIFTTTYLQNVMHVDTIWMLLIPFYTLPKSVSCSCCSRKTNQFDIKDLSSRAVYSTYLNKSFKLRLTT